MPADRKAETWPEGKAPSSVAELVECLERSRVLPAEMSRSVLESLPEGKRPGTAKAAASELLKAGKLTRFQAQCALTGKVKYLAFGEYLVLDKIGQGGMGHVLKAEHRRMKRIVALKIMAPSAMKNADAVRRFQREVHAAARLIHPNIVTAFDANEHEGIHFFVMEYVEGRDLAALLAEHGALPPRQAVEYVLQAARGLAYAHGKGIVHRDIKPGNLLLDMEGTLKILDMGLARMDLAGDEGHELTNTGQVMGTIDYMAPEQAEDTHSADARADIYSLGCTLYRLMTGDVLYSGDTVVKKLMKHRTAPVPLLMASGQRKLAEAGDLLHRLDPIFQKMVAKRPEDRQQTMAQVVKELEECLRGNADTERRSAVSEPMIDLKLSEFLSGISAQYKSQTAVAEKTAKKTAAMEVTQDLGVGDTTVEWQKAGHEATRDRGQATARVPGRLLLRSLVPPYVARHPIPALIALCLASLALAAAGVVVFLPAGDSTIRIEVNDPSIDVTVNETGYKIKGKSEAIHLQPGEHTLHVKAGELEFDTDKFVLGRGTNPAVKVELLPGKVRIARSDGKVLGEKSRPRARGATAAQPPTPNFALEFDGVSNHQVRIQSLIDDCVSPLTVEAWIRPAPLKDSFGTIIGVPNNASGASLRMHNGSFSFFSHLPGEALLHVAGGTFTTPPTHVAGVRDGNVLRLYVDGKQVNETTNSGANVNKSEKGYFCIGYTGGGTHFAGLIDEVRISKVARYSAPFTPAQRFTRDKDTLALYHCDTGQGSELTDDSGNGHHAQIHGAKWTSWAEPPSGARWMVELDGQNSSIVLRELSLPAEGPLTLEAWIKPETVAPNGHLFAFHPSLAVTYDSNGHWLVQSSTTAGYELSSRAAHPADVGLTHIAGVLEGREIRLYIAGKPAARKTLSGTPDGYRTFLIGTGPDNRRLPGTYAEIRISKVARYREAFTPQVQFEPDEHTVALLHCDEGTGNILFDATPNHHIASLNGAKWVRHEMPPGPAATLERDADNGGGGLSNSGDGSATSGVATGGWIDLFNGRDLTGWVDKGHGGWSVKDGWLIGQSVVGMGWLMSQREFDDFELELEYRLPPGGNSGIFLRAAEAGAISGSEFHEIQLLDDTSPKFAQVRPEGRTGALFGKLAANKSVVAGANEWHRLRVKAFGERVQVAIKGSDVLDGALPAGKPSRGHIGLQLYSPGVSFRNVRIRELNSDGSLRPTAGAAPRSTDFGIADSLRSRSSSGTQYAWI